MKIYGFTLKINSKNNLSNHIYSILGFILNIIGNDYYKYISKITTPQYIKNSEYELKIYVTSKEYFNIIINDMFQNINKEYSLDGHTILINSVLLNITPFQEKEYIENKIINKVKLCFNSPTHIKYNSINKKNLYNVLPSPDKYLYNSIKKYINKFNYDNIPLILQTIKGIIEKDLYISYFNIRTKIIEIKGNKKSGVMGCIDYNFLGYTKELGEFLKINKSEYNNIINILLNSLNFAEYTGLGNSSNLGMGDINFKIYYN